MLRRNVYNGDQQTWRLKICSKFKKKTSIEQRTLDKSDIIDVVKHMHNLIDGKGEIDDIDHLANRSCLLYTSDAADE